MLIQLSEIENYPEVYYSTDLKNGQRFKYVKKLCSSGIVNTSNVEIHYNF